MRRGAIHIIIIVIRHNTWPYFLSDMTRERIYYPTDMTHERTYYQIDMTRERTYYQTDMTRDRIFLLLVKHDT